MISTNKKIYIPQPFDPGYIMLDCPNGELLNVQYPQNKNEAIVDVSFKIKNTQESLIKRYNLQTQGNSWNYEVLVSNLLELSDFEGATLI